jgi:imidazolonepropionase
MSLTIINIKGIVQAREEPPQLVPGMEMSHLPVLENGWVHCEQGLIHSFGTMESYSPFSGAEVIDASGRYVMPSYCDSHTHLVYAGSREIEYIDKIKGLSYEEIAKRGGGILNSAALLANTSEEELRC